ncbi:PREDICTED: factor of DNA methylation 2-like [Camelina sativa]|uniref:Factor of DNA methylation 2-like n=1 Tax=Camelina sativa TaxID=90675 RepID=A0ABM1R626_CAMSA|nr:PREDICTED: factor of DNA methylation 2-like [Camelina sativa]
MFYHSVYLGISESIRQDSVLPFELPSTVVSDNANSTTNLEQATSLAFEGRKNQQLLLVIDRIIAEKKAQEKDLRTEMEKLDAKAKRLEGMLEAKNYDEAENELLLMDDDMNVSVQMAALEIGKADESLLKLEENHKMERNELLNKLSEFEKQLETKHILEMENLVRQSNELGKNDDINISVQMAALELGKPDERLFKLVEKQKMERKELLKKLIQFEKQLETKHVQEINLVRQSNDMQAAREVLIEVWPELDAQTDIGIKLMGKLDEKPFLNVCKKKYPAHEATAKAATLFSRWQENLKDSAWHPFKRELTGDKEKEVLDEEDEQLKKLKGEWGEEVHKAVKTAVEEKNEYNASGILELWNFKEERKATLQEVIEFFLTTSNDAEEPERCAITSAVI